MKRLLYGLAALPFLAALASAQPATQLTDNQMDKVTAGWGLLETDISNTSFVMVSVYQSPNTVTCSACYLLINTPSISVGSAFGPSPGQ